MAGRAPGDVGELRERGRLALATSRLRPVGCGPRSGGSSAPWPWSGRGDPCSLAEQGPVTAMGDRGGGVSRHPPGSSCGSGSRAGRAPCACVRWGGGLIRGRGQLVVIGQASIRLL